MLSSNLPSPRNVRLSVTLAALLVLPAGAANAGRLSFSPLSLDFGGNALGESKTLSATLKNTTSAEIVLGAASLVDNPGGYTLVSTTCGATLPAKQNCKYTLRYTASTLQPVPARLELITQSPAFPKLTLPLQANRNPPLNDTGITRCGNDTQKGLTCPVPDFPRQDAQYGRDRTRNVASNGKAGFNFTKLDAQGKDLPASAKNWDCVRDNVTGLVWERKPMFDWKKGNQGMHDADDTYTWYSTDAANNGGNPGEPNPDGNSCSSYVADQPLTYCNTEAYVNRVNAEGWCGAKDWRMPTHTELLGLTDLSMADTGPAIDIRYFPDTRNWSYFWTSTPSIYYASVAEVTETTVDAEEPPPPLDFAWYINFRNGLSNAYKKTGNDLRVRLVRNGQ